MGDNPYVRMMRRPFGTVCNVCGRPTTLFMWKAGRKGRMKRTVICHTCSKLKNACQSCVYDLTYGLPLKVRDEVLETYGGGGASGMEVGVPRSELSLNYFGQQADREVEGMGLDPASAVPPEAHRELLSMADRQPRYERNRPKLCTFHLRGVCTRGMECPYSHDIPEDYWENKEFYQKDIQRSIKDRFFGTKDPTADKMLERHQSQLQELKAPDEDSTTLFVSGVTADVTEQALRDVFYVHGELKSVRISRRSECAFIEYVARAGAETALRDTMGKLVIGDARMRVRWADQQRSGAAGTRLLGDDAVPLAPEAARGAWGGGGRGGGGGGGGAYPPYPPPAAGAGAPRGPPPPPLPPGAGPRAPPPEVLARMDPTLLAMLQGGGGGGAAAVMSGPPPDDGDGGAAGPSRRAHRQVAGVQQLRQQAGPMYPSMHPHRVGASAAAGEQTEK